MKALKLAIAVFLASFAAQALTVNVENALTNRTTTISADYALTGAGGVQMDSLALEATGRLTFDPVRTPVLVKSVPTFAPGARLALDPAYANRTNGRIVLLTWNGASSATIPDGLFDAATAAGAHPALAQETYTAQKSTSSGTATYTRLVLDLDTTLPKTPIKVMPFGDSITENSAVVGFANPNYRITLMQKLAAMGYAPESCGFRRTINVNAAGIYQDDAYCWHGGISGIRLIPKGDPDNRGGYREGLETLLDASGVPDVILFFIGANDTGCDMNDMRASWTNTIVRLAKARPSTKIIAVSVLTFYDAAWRGAFDDFMRETVKNNTLGLPENQLYYVDIDAGFPKTDDRYLQSHGNQHPSWMGHDLTSSAFAAKIDEVFRAPPVKTADGSADQVYVPHTALSAAQNVPAAYRAGYRPLYALDALHVRTNGTGRIAKGGDVPYAFVDADLSPTEKFARVGYYLELRSRQSGNVRWIWADMEAWDEATAAAFALPNDRSLQRRVKALHIATNDAGVDEVPPTDDSVEGYLQFGCGGFQADESAVAEAPAKFCPNDWNVTLDDAASYGIFQVYRLAPEGPGPRLAAETLIAYSRWQLAGTHEVGIGSCSQHNFINYLSSSGSTYERFNLDGYDVARLEVWGLSEAAQMTAQSAAGYDFTNAVVRVAVDAASTAAAGARLCCTLVDPVSGATVATWAQPLAAQTADYVFDLPATLVPGKSYDYAVVVQNADGSSRPDAHPLTGSVTLAASAAPTEWFSAAATSGSSAVRGGAWDETPGIAQNVYVLETDKTNIFVFGVRPAHLASSVLTIEQRILFEEASSAAVLDQGDVTGMQCGLTLGLGDEWKALAGGAWQTFVGASATPGLYDVRFEFDYSTTPGRVRYSVKRPEETDYTPLTTVAGEAWVLNSRPDATKAEALVYQGEGKLTSFKGASADVGVAAAGGQIYASLAAALNAAQPGEDVTLRTNASFDPGQVKAGAAFAPPANYDVVWHDTTHYVGYDDAAEALTVRDLGGASAPPNGVDSYTSYALGLDADEATSRPRAGLAPQADGTYRVTLEGVAPRAGVAVETQLESATQVDFSDAVRSSFTTERSFVVTPETPTGFYRLRVRVGR